jgi:hypothetical protein
MKRVFTVAALAAMAVTVCGVGSAIAATVKVTDADIGAGAWFTADTRPGGSATIESGPSTPPYGSGSLELATTSAGAKAQMLTNLYDGVALSDVDEIGYSTYRDPLATGFIAGVASLNLRVDLDGNGTSDVYMVYEPYQDQGNAAILTGAWQAWDAHRGGDAKWWINTGAGGCGQPTPCTWSAIVSAFPSATIREGAGFPGSLGVNQGSGNAGFLSNVDGLTVSATGQETVYDFEPAIGPPVAKDECKKGGWQTFDTPRNFKNQGDCVSFVASGK